VTISGQQLYRSLPGSGSVWLSTDNSEPSVADAKVITRVEEVALRHYAENGFPEGQMFTLCLCSSLLSSLR